MIDLHYTPNTLAKEMVEYIPTTFTPKIIADFSAGEGSLLLEAAKRWPFAEVLANDLSRSNVKKLISLESKWCISCSDFIKKTSHSNTKFSSKKGMVDVILLNPPFSERGRKLIEWFEQPNIKSGLATRFIRLSLDYLSTSGYMLAILPNGSLSSERDLNGWAQIKKNYNIEIIGNNHSKIFKNAVTNTSLVCIRHKSLNEFIKTNKSEKLHPKVKFLEVIHRGVIQMHSIKYNSNGYPLVHTTDLIQEKLNIDSKNKLALSNLIVQGPALLFPRVGAITPKKICNLESDIKIVLSDCVLAIEFSDINSLIIMRKYILNDWHNFSKIYDGTGAKYTTIKKANSYFNTVILNINQEIKIKKRILN
ncbi:MULTISPECIES: methyltransferase [unclassified Providencia]|uniref:methyltransferase n=1 Tax=unclassified Providencia TaxID=2633465 RepID=UPI0023496DA6|nr:MULTISPECIES: methyltransferase [unclassified Providencia]